MGLRNKYFECCSHACSNTVSCSGARQATAPVNLDALQELCSALTAAALSDEDAALSAADFVQAQALFAAAAQSLSTQSRFSASVQCILLGQHAA